MTPCAHHVKNVEINLKNRLHNEHYPSILVTFLRETEHFSDIFAGDRAF